MISYNISDEILCMLFSDAVSRQHIVRGAMCMLAQSASVCSLSTGAVVDTLAHCRAVVDTLETMASADVAAASGPGGRQSAVVETLASMASADVAAASGSGG